MFDYIEVFHNRQRLHSAIVIIPRPRRGQPWKGSPVTPTPSASSCLSSEPTVGPRRLVTKSVRGPGPPKQGMVGARTGTSISRSSVPSGSQRG
jgi:hypothetical protein